VICRKSLCPRRHFSITGLSELFSSPNCLKNQLLARFVSHRAIWQNPRYTLFSSQLFGGPVALASLGLLISLLDNPSFKSEQARLALSLENNFEIGADSFSPQGVRRSAHSRFENRILQAPATPVVSTFAHRMQPLGTYFQLTATACS
jgi:hypothetical protein